MAATLDIIMITINCLSINKVVKYINESYNLKVQISKITQIDNWYWEGECELLVSETINNCLLNEKIIVVSLTSSLFKNLGIYVERIDKKYIYTFWIDTETYPELDTDVGNEHIYLKIFRGIEQMTKNLGYIIDVIAIGIETNLVYQKNRFKTVKKSQNISDWSFDKCNIMGGLFGYNHTRISDREIFIHK